MNSKLTAYFELTRPLNVLITFLSIAAACVLAGGTVALWLNILFASLAGALIAAGANTINDYFDVDIDRINKPHRPLPRGAVTPTEAWVLWLRLSLVGILLNVFLNSGALLIAVIAAVALYAYSAYFKRTILAGNVLVGIMTGLAFVYGGVVVGDLKRAIIPAMFAFLINVAREIIKDVEDVEGDAIEEAHTFPVRHGVKPALILATVILLALVATTLVPYHLQIYGLTYLIVVLIVDAAILFVVISMWLNSSPMNLAKLSYILKVNMLIGLVAIFLGSP